MAEQQQEQTTQIHVISLITVAKIHITYKRTIKMGPEIKRVYGLKKEKYACNFAQDIEWKIW